MQNKYIVIVLEKQQNDRIIINKYEIHTPEYQIISKTGKVIYKSIDFDLINKTYQEKFKDKIGYKLVLTVVEKLDPNNVGEYLSQESITLKEKEKQNKKESYKRIKNQLPKDFNKI